MKVYNFSEHEAKYIKCIVAPFKSRVPGSVWSLEHKELSEIKKKMKQHYLREQNSTCFACKQRVVVKHSAAWDIEHIVSRDENPDYCFEPLNMCVTCKDCNNEKLDKKVLTGSRHRKYPRSSKHYKIIHPHFDEYDHHVEVIQPGLLYKSITQKGESTIKIYGLKRFLYQKFLPECSTKELAEKFLAAAKIISDCPEGSDQLITLVSINYALEKQIKKLLL